MRAVTDRAGGPSVHFCLLCALLAVLWLAGGASRGDVLGQVVARAGAWAALVVAALFGARTSWRAHGPVALLLATALLIVAVQLVPLPPALWQSMPGREALAPAATLCGQAQPWRPISIVPGATANAAFSLVVPVATLILLGGVRKREWDRLPGILLGFVGAGALVGLVQFSGTRFDNPFVNDTVGQVSGTFANRNHFALLLAIGCALIPVWAFSSGRRAGWRAPAAVGLLALFVLTILATGSRAGLILGAVGSAAGLLLVRGSLRQELRRYPRWATYAVAGGGVVLLAALVFASVTAGRAISIDRAFSVDTEQDIRSRALPTVIAMMREYFPVGTGFGAFDPVFRMHEPFALLKPTYFNHAHNDYLEVVLNAGLAGFALLAVALLWWAWASVRAWRPRAAQRLEREDRVSRRLGSVVLLLILVASIVDFPARTPTIMAVAIIAACWLSRRAPDAGRSPLPGTGQPL